MDKQFTVAIIGMGGRGRAYSREMLKLPEKFKIVAFCDITAFRVNDAKKDFGYTDDMYYDNEDAFFAKKLADICVVATQDQDHVRHAIKALELGYDVLMEKPISDKEEECRRLLEAQRKYGGKVFVCHVLRYAPAFVKAKEFLNQGAIGKLVQIEALERVGYWHQAHSYVRGNWRNLECSAPMILAKCCHDLDLLQYYAGSKCTSVSSVGDLTYFKEENAPAGSTDRCATCPHIDTCAFSAKHIYINRWKERGCPVDIWPFNVLVQAPLTEEKQLTSILPPTNVLMEGMFL
jgi:predicted dehydrogenase